MSRLYARGHSLKSGKAPGTLIHVGEKHASAVSLELIEFDGTGVTETGSVSVETAMLRKESPRVKWLNVTGLSDTDLVAKLCSGYGVHPLVQEDILHTSQRPKVEVYDDHIYMVVKMIRYDEKIGELDIEQVSIILADSVVITFQEKEGDVFDPVRERIRSGKGLIRKQGADYLAYALMDAVIDNYFLALEKMGEDVDAIEDQVTDHAGQEVANMIHRLKRELILLRRAVWPLRDGLAILMRDALALVKPGTQPFIRDLHDHTIQIMDTVESFRDMASGLLDVYLSSVSNRTNSVMKVLTIISTIFIPLTFIAGIYGMNFRRMPELSYPWAYPAVLLLCALIAIGMLLWFRRKGWL